MFLYILFSLGIGCFLILLPSFVATQNYFDKRKSLAMGVLLCGVSLGTLISPPLIVWLAKELALPGLFMVYGGITLQSMWLAALLRPQIKPDNAISNDVTPGHDSREARVGNRLVMQTNQESQESEVHQSELKSGNGNIQYSELDAGGIMDKPSNADATSTTWSTQIIKVLGLHPCKQLPYIVYVMGMLLMQTAHLVWFAYLPLRGISLGATEEQAALLVTVMAVTAMVCRVLAGVLADCIPHQRRYALPAIVMINAVLTICSGFASSWQMLGIFAISFGILSGKFLCSRLVNEYFVSFQ